LTQVKKEARSEIEQLNDLFDKAPLGYQSLSGKGSIIEVDQV